MDKNLVIRKLLESFFMVAYFWGFMRLTDWLMNTFVHSVGLMNILTVPALFVSVLLSAWLSERTVKTIKKYL